MTRILASLFILVSLGICRLFSAEEEAAAGKERIDVKVARFYYPNTPDDPTTKNLINLMRTDPDIKISQWGGLPLPGGAGRAPIMMSIAGQTAPDIMESWFHILDKDINQGFLYPLNEWIGEDNDGNGQIDNDEAIWPGWKQIPLLWRQVATKKGKVYALPQATKNYMGVIFRTDLARSAGLDPENPPQTWDEFIYWCQKLTDPKRDVPGAILKEGQRGIALTPYGFTWLPWMQSAGGDPIVQKRKSPKTGKEFDFAVDSTSFVSPDGEDLSEVEPVWRANFASKEGIAAAELFQRLRWMKWMIDPETGEPVNLTKEELLIREVRFKGRLIKFTEKDIITGVARGQTGQRGTGAGELLARGEVGMFTWFVQDLFGFGQGMGLNPELLSWFPFPAGPAPKGRRVVQIQRHYAVITEGVGRRSKEERDKVWEAITTITSQKVVDDAISKSVLSGLANFINPLDLHRLGFDDYLKDVPEAIKKNFKEIENGKIQSFTEPYMGFWVPMDSSLNTMVLSQIIAETGENFEVAGALKRVETEANSGAMFTRSEKELSKYRIPALAIFSVLVLAAGYIVFLIIRSFFQKKRSGMETSKSVTQPLLPWLMIAPAILIIGLWSYYPLFKGMIMAFQDYKIIGKSTFVGLDNFINLALDKTFWISLWRTIEFVFLNVILAFCIPIALAMLLSEVPRGKIFFRTLFFLPQVTSGLVIALIWKMLYDPTPNGLLNQFIGILNYLPLVNIAPQTWLQDPNLAMLCCIIPTVWASMGLASLLYLAALKSVPEEIYEAVEVDGGGIITKLRTVTIPTLMPLIIINFVGAFIGTFQNMGNIFLLTFGGPGDSTTVIALKIWIEAYNNLRFSMATTMAWILGSLLIGFTYIQIRLLRQVEFRKANWD